MRSPNSNETVESEKHPLDLILLLLWSVVAVIVAIVLPDGNFIRVIFGTFLLVFIPGYALVAILWPGKDGIGNMERIALSFGLSIVVVSVIGLILNFTSNGITLSSTLAGLFIIQIILTIFAYMRRQQLTEQERYHIALPMPQTLLPSDKTEKLFVIMISVVLVLSGCVLAYVLMTPSDGERYSQLYILDSNGTAENYTLNMTTNGTASIIVGIRCHEYEEVNYKVIIGIENATTINDGSNWDQTFSFTGDNSFERDITLDHDGIFEDIITFNIPDPGKHKVVWQLYIDGVETEYEVHLWVIVK